MKDSMLAGSMFHRLYSLLILLSFSTCISNVHSLCLLCVMGTAGLKRPHYLVDEIGTTCVRKALDMALNLEEKTWECSTAISKNRDLCCGNEEPDPIPQIVSSAPKYDGPYGGYPPCDICKGKGRATNDAMVISVLYIGTDSCDNFYDYAMAGFVQRHMCAPLQHYAYAPCGCGEFASDDSGESNDNGEFDDNGESGDGGEFTTDDKVESDNSGEFTADDKGNSSNGGQQEEGSTRDSRNTYIDSNPISNSPDLSNSFNSNTDDLAPITIRGRKQVENSRYERKKALKIGRTRGGAYNHHGHRKLIENKKRRQNLKGKKNS